jgi:hypothetical protein
MPFVRWLFFTKLVRKQLIKRVQDGFCLLPLALTCTVLPVDAASNISPIIELPPTVWPSLLTCTSASNFSTH